MTGQAEPGSQLCAGQLVSPALSQSSGGGRETEDMDFIQFPVQLCTELCRRLNILMVEILYIHDVQSNKILFGEVMKPDNQMICNLYTNIINSNSNSVPAPAYRPGWMLFHFPGCECNSSHIRQPSQCWAITDKTIVHNVPPHPPSLMHPHPRTPLQWLISH